MPEIKIYAIARAKPCNASVPPLTFGFGVTEPTRLYGTIQAPEGSRLSVANPPVRKQELRVPMTGVNAPAGSVAFTAFSAVSAAKQGRCGLRWVPAPEPPEACADPAAPELPEACAAPMDSAAGSDVSLPPHPWK